MIITKKLNKIQAEKLFKDIHGQDVKKLGTYKVGKYYLYIFEQEVMDRLISSVYKLKEKNDAAKLKYKDKLKKGICSRCNKKALKNSRYCKYHREKQNEYNLNRLYKKAKSKNNWRK